MIGVAAVTGVAEHPLKSQVTEALEEPRGTAAEAVRRAALQCREHGRAPVRIEAGQPG
jgi:hypothetical protein